MVGFRWAALLAVSLAVVGCGGFGARVASEAASPTDRNEAGQSFGFITAVDPERRTITFDPAQWVSGPLPDGTDYSIQNPARRTRVFRVAPNAIVTAAVPVTALGTAPPASCRRVTEPCASYPITLEAFFASWKPDPCKCMYKFWLTIRGDVVYRLDEQYTP